MFPGLGVASNLLLLQLPLMRGFLPDIEIYSIGTIYVQLDHALDIKIPDIVTPPLQWELNSSVGERFIHQRQARAGREAF